MPEFDINVEFEVFCADCGGGLCRVSQGHSSKQGPFVEVGSCERCEQEAYDRGYHAGIVSDLSGGSN